jgi:MFS family permease
MNANGRESTYHSHSFASIRGQQTEACAMNEPLLSEYEKPSRRHYAILLLCWAGWLFDFYDLILFTFLLIPIRQELHLTKEPLSYALGASLAATALGGVVFGHLADRYGRKMVLQWTILTYSLGTFLCGFAASLPLLIVFRVVTGIGVGGEWATGQTYVGETFPPKVRGRYGAFMQTGAPLGVALASVVGGYLMPHIGWRACFMVSALPALLVVLIRKTMPESDLWLASRAGTAEPSESVGAGEGKGGSSFSVLWQRAYRPLFLRALILATFDLSAYWFTYSWLPDYLQEQRGFSLAKSAAFILVTQAGGFLGYSTFGFVADSLGRRPAYSLYSVFWALGLAMVTILWEAIVNQPSVILGFMFLVGFGTGMFGGYGPLFAELFPTGIRNTAMGAAFNLARGAQFFTPVIIAVVARRYGLGGGISLAALFALLTGLWIWTFPETRGKKLET